MSLDPVIIASIVAAYLLGSIPTGLWLGLWLRGVDIRAHGSRNIGATNTLRVLGKGLGGAAFAADIAKGLAPVLVAGWISSWPHLPLACGVAAVLGHVFSVFLKFRGGKGVATSTGVFLGLVPLPTLLAALVFAAVAAATRMVSAGSLSAAVTLCIAVFLFETTVPVRLVAVLLAVLVFYKHRANIGRILRGEENRFGRRKASEP